MKIPKKTVLPILLLLIWTAPLLLAGESPYSYRVRFSDTMKISEFNLEHNTIDTFEFEGTVHWTDHTELYGRIKLDNWSDSAGGMLFGSELDQRYGMAHEEIFDKSYIRSALLREIGLEEAGDLEFLFGYNAGGVLHKEWTAFDFENYRMAGIRGVVFQTDAALWDNLYLTAAFNPALGSSNSAWRGLNGALSERADILTALSWRGEEWWTELYWDSLAYADASRQGPELSVLGQSTFMSFTPLEGMDLTLSERVEYGISGRGSREDQLRLSFAGGMDLHLLHGLSSNLSLNGFFMNRREMNIGWDTELLVTESLGILTALGGIRLIHDPDFVYEAGISGHFNYLSLYLGYSDHKGGNEGWFSGAFDTTRSSGGGLFIRLDIEY